MSGRTRLIARTVGILVFALVAGSFFYQNSSLKGHSLRQPTGDGIWNLPAALSSANLEVTFEVDTSLLLVTGIASNIEGRAWLEDINDYRTVKATAGFLTNGLNTGNLSRDKKLQSVMHSVQFPSFTFKVNEIKDLCSPAEVSQSPCKAKINGELNLNGVTRELTFPIEVVKIKNRYHIEGQSSLNWRDFKIDDASTFLAKLYDSVRLKFSLDL